MRFNYRINDYIEIPAIPDLEHTTQLTIGVCIRGQSLRSLLVEFNAPPSGSGPWTKPYFWVGAPDELYINNGAEAAVVTADITAHSGSWLHAAYTLSADTGTLTLHVNGLMEGSAPTTPVASLDLPYSIRVGYNPNGDTTGYCGHKYLQKIGTW